MLPTHPASPQTKQPNVALKLPLSPARLQLHAAGSSRCSCRSTTAIAGLQKQEAAVLEQHDDGHGQQQCQACHKHLSIASGLAALMLLSPGPVCAEQLQAPPAVQEPQGLSILLPAGSLAASLSAPEAPALVSNSADVLLEGVKSIVEAGMQDLTTSSMTAVGGPVTEEVVSASANQGDTGAEALPPQLAAAEATQHVSSSNDTSTPVLGQQQPQQQPQQQQHKPRGLWCSAWQAYCDALERSPLPTKIYTGAVGTLLGDLVAQILSHTSKQQQEQQEEEQGMRRSKAFSKGSGFQFDAMRAGRLCLYSTAIATPMSHAWYGLLEASVLPATPLAPAAVAAKVALDQLCQTPFGMVLFFAVMKILEGRPNEVQQELQSKVVPALLANWKLWPAAQLINFTLIPEQQRILYCNIVGIVWTVIISNMQQASASGDTAADPNSSPAAAAATAVAVTRRSSSAGADTDPRLGEAPAGLGFALRRRRSVPA